MADNSKMKKITVPATKIKKGLIRTIIIMAMLTTVGGTCDKEIETQGRRGKAPKPFSVLECGTSAALLSESPIIRWAQTLQSWQHLYISLHQNQLPPPEAPAVDLDKYGVLLLYAGQFRQAGYELTIKEWSVEGTALQIEVELEESEAPFQAQVITTPYCLLLIDRAKVEKVQLETELPFPQKSIDLTAPKEL